MAHTEQENTREYSLFIPAEQSWETLLLTPLGHNQFRLEETSFTELGLFYHDIIEAEPKDGKEVRFVRRVERSGLRVFQFLLSKRLTESEVFAAFLQRVEAHGGYWEQIFGGILLVHLPRGSACRPKSELRTLFQTLNEVPA